MDGGHEDAWGDASAAQGTTLLLGACRDKGSPGQATKIQYAIKPSIAMYLPNSLGPVAIGVAEPYHIDLVVVEEVVVGEVQERASVEPEAAVPLGLARQSSDFLVLQQAAEISAWAPGLRSQATSDSG